MRCGEVTVQPVNQGPLPQFASKLAKCFELFNVQRQSSSGYHRLLRFHLNFMGKIEKNPLTPSASRRYSLVHFVHRRLGWVFAGCGPPCRYRFFLHEKLWSSISANKKFTRSFRTCCTARCPEAKFSRQAHKGDQHHCICLDSRPAYSQAIPVANTNRRFNYYRRESARRSILSTNVATRKSHKRLPSCRFTNLHIVFIHLFF